MATETFLRHQEYLREKGLSEQEMKTLLESVYSEASVNKAADQTQKQIRSTPIGQRIIELSEAQGLPGEGAERLAQHLAMQQRLAFSQFGLSLLGTLVRVLIVWSIAVFVFLYIAHFTMPVVLDLVDGQYEVLPEMSQTAFTVTRYVEWLLLIPFSFILICAWMFLQYRRVMLLQRDGAGWMHWIPGGRQLLSRLNNLVRIEIYSWLRSEGKGHRDAFGLATVTSRIRTSFLSERELAKELKCADRLGILIQEIEYQRRRFGVHDESYPALVLQRSLAFVLILVTSVMVTTLLVAMYLPLFSLSTII